MPSEQNETQSLSKTDRYAIQNLNRMAAVAAFIISVYIFLFSWVTWHEERTDRINELTTITELGSKAIDVYLATLAKALLALGNELAATGDPISLERASVTLQRFKDAHPELINVVLLRPNGELVATAVTLPDSDRPPLAQEPSEDSRNEWRPENPVALGRPLFNDQRNTVLIPLQHSIRDPQGRVNYLICLYVTKDLLQSFWQEAPIIQKAALGLIRDDGFLLSRYPVPDELPPEEIYGKPRSGALIVHLQQNNYPPSGVVTGLSSLGGPDFLTVFRRLPHFPATLFVAMPQSAIRIGWWEQVRWVYSFMLVLFIGGGVIYRFALYRQQAWDSERQDADAALRDRENRLQRVFEGSNDGFWDWNAATGEVIYSRRWAEILGYDSAEIEPTLGTWGKLAHPDDLPQVWASVQAHFADETPRFENEHRLLAKNGEWRWVQGRGKVASRDAHGQPLWVSGTTTDIHERKRIQAALQDSETRFSSLVRLLPCGVQENDVTGRVTFANPALEHLHGRWGENSVVGRFIWDFLADDAEREPLRDYLAHLVREQPPPTPFFAKNRHAQGHVIDVQIDWAYRYDMYGQLQGFIAVITDITERKRAHEALWEQATHDTLTGLFNRRYLDEILPRELQRRRRSGEPLTIALLDLDHFKHFNDAFGHEAGDLVLQAVGALLRRSLRASDIACRYGGEELTVVMSGSTVRDARNRLDEIRQAITYLHLLHQSRQLPLITVSIGVTEAVDEETDPKMLLGRADAALYQAKAQGRNQVVIA